MSFLTSPASQPISGLTVLFLADASGAASLCDLVLLARHKSHARHGDRIIYLESNCR